MQAASLLLLTQHWADDALSTLFCFSYVCTYPLFPHSFTLLACWWWWSYILRLKESPEKSDLFFRNLALFDIIRLHDLHNIKDSFGLIHWLVCQIPSDQCSVSSVLCENDWHQFSVPLCMSNVLLAHSSIMGQQGGSSGLFAGDMSPAQGGTWAIFNPSSILW